MIDASEFLVGIADFLEELDVDAALAQKKITLDILAGAVVRTPADTGRARGNWQATIGSPAVGENRTGDPVSAGTRALASLQPYGMTWVTNNVPYISVLEFGLFTPKNPGPSKDPRPGRKGKILVKDGYSTQAPKGMVRLTLEDVLRKDD